MSRAVVFGQASYLHVHSVLFALTEKGVTYRLQPADAAPVLLADAEHAITAGEPAIEVGGKLVRDKDVALRFVEDGFLGPRLQPEDPFERAQMNLALETRYREAVVTMGSRITRRYLTAIVANEWLDPAPSEAIVRDARRTVATFESILGTGPFLAGNQFSLADVAIACLFDNIMELPEGSVVVPDGTPMRDWWNRVRTREAFLAVRPKIGPQFGLLQSAWPGDSSGSFQPHIR
jgi:glutathione S-transferase